MTAGGYTATRVELVLDQYGMRATFSMHGPTWKGGPLRFELVAREHGYALCDDDETDPLDDRFAEWGTAVEAFADLVRLHVWDELAPSEVGLPLAEPEFDKMDQRDAERVLRAVYGPQANGPKSNEA